MDLWTEKSDAADLQLKGFVSVERQVGGAGEFEAAAELRQVVVMELDADAFAEGQAPDGGDFAIEAGARIGRSEFRGGAMATRNNGQSIGRGLSLVRLWASCRLMLIGEARRIGKKLDDGAGQFR